jgi:hypothetical protein
MSKKRIIALSAMLAWAVALVVPAADFGPCLLRMKVSFSGYTNVTCTWRFAGEAPGNRRREDQGDSAGFAPVRPAESRLSCTGRHAKP